MTKDEIKQHEQDFEHDVEAGMKMLNKSFLEYFKSRKGVYSHRDVEKIVAQEFANLLQLFNDYENPLQMSSEYVRDKIIKYMEEK